MQGLNHQRMFGALGGSHQPTNSKRPPELWLILRLGWGKTSPPYSTDAYFAGHVVVNGLACAHACGMRPGNLSFIFCM